MTSWGYARVSRADQNPQLQIDALRRAGVDDEHLVVEHRSGVDTKRPGLEGLLAGLAEEDSLTVWRLDRLGRSTPHLLKTIRDLDDRGVTFRSVTDPIDTSSASGRLILSVFAALGEFERDLLVERTTAGLEAARGRGVTLGRRTEVTPEAAEHIMQLAEAGMSHRQIALRVRHSRQVVGRVVRGEIASLRRYTHPTQETAS